MKVSSVLLNRKMPRKVATIQQRSLNRMMLRLVAIIRQRIKMVVDSGLLKL